MSAEPMKKQKILTYVFIVFGVAAILFFGTRVIQAYKKFEGRRPPPPGAPVTDVELIRGWMTIPYIAQMYGVPEPILFDGLNIPPQGNRGKSLKDLDGEFFPAPEDVILDKVKTIILENPPPPSPAPSMNSGQRLPPKGEGSLKSPLPLGEG